MGFPDTGSTMPASVSAYPLKIDASIESKVRNALVQVRKNLLSANGEWLDKTRTEITGPTRTSDFMGFLNPNSIWGLFKDHLLEAVIVVSLRFGWKPEDVFALWTNEGLPAYIGDEGVDPKRVSKKSPAWRSLKDEYMAASTGSRDKKIDLRDPRDRDEARSWARSIVLWTRWGLDTLAPVEYAVERRDNRILIADRAKHDRALNEGYKKELNSFLPENPIKYLSGEESPIQVTKDGQRFRAVPEYQATLLAMQHARFRHKEAEVPPEIDGVPLRPPFPALVYIYFNSRDPDKQESSPVRLLIGNLKRNKAKRGTKGTGISVTDVYEAFVGEEIPSKARARITTKCPPRAASYPICDSYMNALRFEFLRRVYSDLFSGAL